MRLILRCWRLLARSVGENDYERYCAHLQQKHPDRPVPTAREYYLVRLQEKYSRPTRCC